MDGMDAPEPSPTPLLVFDGDCGFCTATVRWLSARLKEPVEVVPWQALEIGELGLSEQDVTRYVWWLEPRPERRSGEGGMLREKGHRAAGRALIACRGPWPLVGGLLLLPPPFSWLWAAGYRLVARYRGYLPGTTPACRRPDWQRRRGDPGDG